MPDPIDSPAHELRQSAPPPEPNTFPAEQFHRLLEAAWKRFDSRLSVEWKTSIGLWTFFGAGAGVVISARVWKPDAIDVVCSAFFSAAIVYWYGRHWLPYLVRSFRRDSALSYFWESGLENSAGTVRPDFLRPEFIQGEDCHWHRMGEELTQAQTETFRAALYRWHTAQWGQFWLTLFFAVMFVGAMWSKNRNHLPQATAPSSPMGSASAPSLRAGSIEAKKFEVDTIKAKALELK